MVSYGKTIWRRFIWHQASTNTIVHISLDFFANMMQCHYLVHIYHIHIKKHRIYASTKCFHCLNARWQICHLCRMSITNTSIHINTTVQIVLKIITTPLAYNYSFLVPKENTCTYKKRWLKFATMLRGIHVHASTLTIYNNNFIKHNQISVYSPFTRIRIMSVKKWPTNKYL